MRYICQSGEGIRIAKIAALVEEPVLQPGGVLAGIAARRQKLADLGAEGFHAQVIHRNTHHCELVRDQSGLGQIEKSRNELALGQIASCSEKHKDTRTGNFTRVFDLGVRVGLDCTRHR